MHQIKHMNHLSKMLLDAMDLYMIYLKKEHISLHSTRQHFIEHVREMVDVIRDERQLFESIAPMIEQLPCKKIWWLWGGNQTSKMQVLMNSVMNVYRTGDELRVLRETVENQRQEIRLLKEDYLHSRKEWDGVILSMQSQWMREQSECYTKHQKELSLMSKENTCLKRALMSRLNQSTEGSGQIQDVSSSSQIGDMRIKNC